MHVEVRRRDRFVGPCTRNDDSTQPLTKLVERLGQAEDRHHFGRDRDFKAGFPRIGIPRSSKTDDDIAQRPVVHIQGALPQDAPGIDIQPVAVMNVVVDCRGQQIVGDADGMDIARKVQVDVLHWRDLRGPAAGSASLHAETGPQRGLPETHGRALAQPVQRVAQTHGRGGLSLAGGRRIDRRDQHQFSGGITGQAVAKTQRNLGLVPAVDLQLIFGYAQLSTDLADMKQIGLPRDFDIRQYPLLVASIPFSFPALRRLPPERVRSRPPFRSRWSFDPDPPVRFAPECGERPAS